ncbi:Nitrogen assimilation transcription factor nit-4 [Fusarium oxysporum f. sp. albedinis]|nr:Nitrogen assimilation transcription factor nit-4 [Fusarium oxysporum f. sp. albedinis]
MSQSRCHWGSIDGDTYRLSGVALRSATITWGLEIPGSWDPGFWGLPGSTSGECIGYIFLPTPYGCY